MRVFLARLALSPARFQVGLVPESPPSPLRDPAPIHTKLRPVSTATDTQTDRVARLRTRMLGDGLDALVITGPGSIRWLTGYAGSNGLCIVTATEQRFLTDFRYGTGVAYLRDSWDVQVVDQNLVGVIGEQVPALLGDARRIGFEATRLTYANWLTPRRGRPGERPRARRDDEPAGGRPRRQGARRDRPDPRRRRDQRPRLRVARLRGARRPLRARLGGRDRRQDARARRRRLRVPRARRLGRERRLAARRRRLRADRAQHPRRARSRRDGERLLLRLHAHLRDRPHRRCDARGVRGRAVRAGGCARARASPAPPASRCTRPRSA